MFDIHRWKCGMEWKKEKDVRVQKFKNEDIKYKGKLLKS